MPTEDRGPINSVRPTGWINKSYEIVSGGYLYNRCHLIGFQLTGENANERNLITGTRYMNVQGMLPFENKVADYIKETGNHVLYRATPVFVGNELLARGVQIEAWSVEDEGDGVCFNVYVYNVQPGIILTYATGENRLDTDPAPETPPAEEEPPATDGGETAPAYVLNTNTKRFHKPDCSSVAAMAEKNKQEYTGTRDALLEDGYVACGSCKP